MGDTLLVRIDPDASRPLIVTRIVLIPEADQILVSGPIMVEPDDYAADLFRRVVLSRGRVHSRRLDGLVFLAFGELLSEGDGIGQWQRRD